MSSHLATTVREFVHEEDVEITPGSLTRQTQRIILAFNPNRPDEHNSWSARFRNEGVSYDWSSTETKARDRWADGVRKARIKIREAEAEGRYARGYFTIGSFVKDGPKGD
jgi:hypothetical protein